MTPSDFNRELLLRGWLSMARTALGLRPAEIAVLRLLMAARGAMVTYGRILEDQPLQEIQQRGPSRDPWEAARTRVFRLRSKLDAIGCGDTIQNFPNIGYQMTVQDERRVHRAIEASYGVETAA